MFEKDVEYVVIDNKVKIVDEQTGRIMEGRRYSDGLHQAIEAKSVKVKLPRRRSRPLQNYFICTTSWCRYDRYGRNRSQRTLEYLQAGCHRHSDQSVIRDDKDDVIYKTKRRNMPPLSKR